MKPVPVFTDLSRLTKVLRVLLFITMAFSLELLFGSIRTLWIIEHPELRSAGPSDETWQNVVAIASSAISCIAVVVFLVWLFKAYKNMVALNTALPTTPGWAVGYFFVPYLSLYRPFQIVRDLWKASGSPTDWQTQKSTLLILGWWSFRIISSLMSVATLSARPAETEQALEPYRVFYALDIVLQLTDIAYCGLEAILIGKIWKRMQAHAPQSTR